MSQSDATIFPFRCPNPECSHQFLEFPGRDEDNAIRCPICQERFRPRIEFTADQETRDTMPEFVKQIESAIRREISE